MVEVLEEDVDGHDGDGAQDCFGEHATAAEAADCRGTPDCGGRGQTLDRIAVLEDDTCAQETDTGHHLRDHTAVVSAYDTRRHEHVQRTTYRYKRYRTRADHFAMYLAFHSNEVTQGRSQHDFRDDDLPIRMNKII